MAFRSEHIYRDGWPESSRIWARDLLEQLGLEWEFWAQPTLTTRREKLAVVLICCRLKLRHNLSCTEVAALFNRARSGIHPYTIRAAAILKADPELWRAIMLLDGADAPMYLITTFGELWETLFDEAEPDQLAALN